MSEILVDTISERTPAAGVTVDGVLLKDARVVIGGIAVLNTQQAHIANVDASVVDNTYGSQEATVIADLRTKLDGVLAILAAHGLMA